MRTPPGFKVASDLPWMVMPPVTGLMQDQSPCLQIVPPAKSGSKYAPRYLIASSPSPKNFNGADGNDRAQESSPSRPDAERSLSPLSSRTCPLYRYIITVIIEALAVTVCESITDTEDILVDAFGSLPVILARLLVAASVFHTHRHIDVEHLSIQRPAGLGTLT